MKSYIEDLFRYIDTYENNYSQFETEAFIQTYNGIITVYQTLRTDRNQAVEVDYFFLDKLKLSPLTSSDLRQVTVQTLITRFESEVDTDGRSNQAYSYCRNLRPVKQDVPFFENILIKVLFEPGSLNTNFRLNSFFLEEIGSYINNFGKSVKIDISPEEFDSFTSPLKVLELMRRRLSLGTDIINDRNTLEFHLKRVDAFNRIATINDCYKQYFTQWQYLSTTSFWSNIVSWFSEITAKSKGAFKSIGYFRLLCSQRHLAYLVYVLLIIMCIAMAFGVPSFWNGYSEDKLIEIQEKANSLYQSGK